MKHEHYFDQINKSLISFCLKYVVKKLTFLFCWIPEMVLIYQQIGVKRGNKILMLIIWFPNQQLKLTLPFWYNSFKRTLLLSVLWSCTPWLSMLEVLYYSAQICFLAFFRRPWNSIARQHEYCALLIFCKTLVVFSSLCISCTWCSTGHVKRVTYHVKF